MAGEEQARMGNHFHVTPENYQVIDHRTPKSLQPPQIDQVIDHAQTDHYLSKKF
jgi:hypothetical protein